MFAGEAKPQKIPCEEPWLACVYIGLSLCRRGESAFSCKWDFFSLDEHLPLVHVAYPKGEKDDELLPEKAVELETVENSSASQIQEKKVIYCRKSSGGGCPGSPT